MYLQRVRVVGRAIAAALAHVSTVVTPPAPAAQNLGVGLKRPLPGAGVWRRAWGDGARSHFATRHVEMNFYIFIFFN